MKTIYCDHAATTPVDPRVVEAMSPYFGAIFGNASSVHGHGRVAKQALEEAREEIAAAIGALPREIVFTSGGTEADNSAIAGTFRAAQRAARRGRIVVGAAEHHAVLDCAEGLKEDGAECVVLPVSPLGHVDREALRRELAVPTSLLSVMHANNEVGAIEDIATLAAMAHAAGALMHTDAVQSFGKVRVDVGELGVDLLSLSAHKLYGPKGIGALYVRTGTELEGLLRGGGQERGRRPGTENVALAVGFALAARLALENMEMESARLQRLRDTLQKEIVGRFPEVMVNGDQGARLPHILSIAIDARRHPLEGEMLVVNMDLRGIAVSSGSACTSGSVQPSHVLLAMGREEATARAALRFSFGKMNGPDDVQAIIAALEEILGRS